MTFYCCVSSYLKNSAYLKEIARNRIEIKKKKWRSSDMIPKSYWWNFWNAENSCSKHVRPSGTTCDWTIGWLNNQNGPWFTRWFLKSVYQVWRVSLLWNLSPLRDLYYSLRNFLGSLFLLLESLSRRVDWLVSVSF